MRKNIKSISRQTMQVLANSPWKGNVRELANFIERAVILSQGEELEVPIAELQVSHSRTVSIPASTFHEAERTVILEALKAASGQISGHGGAAERLGLKRTTLQNKMRRLGINKGVINRTVETISLKSRCNDGTVTCFPCLDTSLDTRQQASARLC